MTASVMVGSVYKSLSGLFSRRLMEIRRSTADSLERLSTGQRILRPSDDPANFSILTRLDSQIRGLNQASLNINQALGITSTADAALSSLSDIVADLQELALEAADGALSAEDRALLQQEASGLLSEFSQLALETNFGGRKLLDGSFTDFYVQTGAGAGQGFSFNIGDARSHALGKLAIYSGAQGSLTNAIGTSSAYALQINGISIGSSVSDGVSTNNASSSGIAIANAINAKSSQTGVRAEALATTRTLYIDSFGGSFSGTFSANDFNINGVSITGAVSNEGEFIDAINEQSASTGVTAELDGNGDVVLTAEDGRNIQVTISDGSGNGVYHIFNITSNESFFGVAASSLSSGATNTMSGAIQLYSSQAITITGGGSLSQTIGLTSGLKTLVSGTSTVNIDISSQQGASTAIKILDATLEDILGLQSQVAAVHSRLDFRAAFILGTKLAMEEAQLQIGGVNEALELANITAQEILQEATLAAMTQANTSYAAVSRLLSESFSS